MSEEVQALMRLEDELPEFTQRLEIEGWPEKSPRNGAFCGACWATLTGYEREPCNMPDCVIRKMNASRAAIKARLAQLTSTPQSTPGGSVPQESDTPQ